MNIHLANASSVSGDFGIFRNTLRVKWLGKLGTLLTPARLSLVISKKSTEFYTNAYRSYSSPFSTEC